MEKQKKVEEMAIFKTLPLKGKLEHIWIYYKFVIIGAIAAVIVLGSLLNMYIINPAKPIFAQVSIYGRYVNPNRLMAVHQYMQGYLDGEYGAQTQIRVDNFEVRAATGDDGYNMAQAQRFTANLFVRELDLIVFTRAFAPHLVDLEIFMDLRNVLSAEELDELDDRVDPGCRFIRLPYDSELARLTGISEELYIGVIVNTARLENASEILKKLIHENRESA
jgi:hypothetical protein